MKTRWTVSWHKDLGPNRGETGDTLESYNSKEEAIRSAKEAFNTWGTSGHQDYKGVWWSVDQETDYECFTVYETERCE